MSAALFDRRRLIEVCVQAEQGKYTFTRVHRFQERGPARVVQSGLRWPFVQR